MDEWNGTAVAAPDPPAPDPRPLDAATIVSIGSSCVILISGAIAVVCLIVYMKKSEQQMQSWRQMPAQSPHALSICAKCGAAVALTRLESKRSIGVTTETTDDDTRRQEVVRSSPVVSKAVNESALYAISNNLEDKSDGFLGVILGHISEDLDTTYSADCNVAVKSRLPFCSHSQCSSAPDSELARIHGQRFPEMDLYESVEGSEGGDTPTDPGIRQFTESPPEPNERRQGVVQHAPAQEVFGALSRQRSRRPTWKLETQATTMKCRSALTESTWPTGESSDSEAEDARRTIDC